MVLDAMSKSIDNMARNGNFDKISIKLASKSCFDLIGRDLSKLGRTDYQRLFLEAAFVMVYLERPEVRSLWSDASFMQDYPQFSHLDCIELEKLLFFRNWMRVCLRLISAKGHKDNLIQLVTRLSEGYKVKYVTGGGQRADTARRVRVYEQESGVRATKRPPRRNEIALAMAKLTSLNEAQIDPSELNDLQWMGKRERADSADGGGGGGGGGGGAGGGSDSGGSQCSDAEFSEDDDNEAMMAGHGSGESQTSRAVAGAPSSTSNNSSSNSSKKKKIRAPVMIENDYHANPSYLKEDEDSAASTAGTNLLLACAGMVSTFPPSVALSKRILTPQEMVDSVLTGGPLPGTGSSEGLGGLGVGGAELMLGDEFMRKKKAASKPSQKKDQFDENGQLIPKRGRGRPRKDGLTASEAALAKQSSLSRKASLSAQQLEGLALPVSNDFFGFGPNSSVLPAPLISDQTNRQKLLYQQQKLFNKIQRQKNKLMKLQQQPPSVQLIELLQQQERQEHLYLERLMVRQLQNNLMIQQQQESDQLAAVMQQRDMVLEHPYQTYSSALAQMQHGHGLSSSASTSSYEAAGSGLTHPSAPYPSASTSSSSLSSSTTSSMHTLCRSVSGVLSVQSLTDVPTPLPLSTSTHHVSGMGSSSSFSGYSHSASSTGSGSDLRLIPHVVTTDSTTGSECLVPSSFWGELAVQNERVRVQAEPPSSGPSSSSFDPGSSSSLRAFSSHLYCDDVVVKSRHLSADQLLAVQGGVSRVRASGRVGFSDDGPKFDSESDNDRLGGSNSSCNSFVSLPMTSASSVPAACESPRPRCGLDVLSEMSLLF